ncbi:MAG: EAL domain-containing protein [Methylophagaceae bacterium]
MKLFSFPKKKKYDNQFLEKIEGLLNHSLGNDSMTNYPSHSKLFECGELLIKHCNLNKEPALFCVNFINHTEISLLKGGSEGHFILWQKILDAFSNSLPESAYCGHTTNGVVIHLWGDACEKKLLETIHKISGSLKKLKFTHRPLVLHSGYTVYPEDTETLIQVQPLTVSSTMAALYPEPDPLSSRIQRFTKEIEKNVIHNLNTESAVIEAVKNHDFSLFYQPQFELKTGKLIGAEALARFSSSGLSLSKTYEYILIIENNSYIIDFTKFSFMKLIMFYQEYRHHISPEFRFSFNLSPAILNWSYFDFVDFVTSHVRQIPDIAKHLTIEVTETAYCSEQQGEYLLTILKGLKELGIKIAIDDFGSGYGSMKLLASDIPHIIKLDRTLTTDICSGSSTGIYIQKLIQSINLTGHNILCEGIETEIQKDFLIEHDVAYGQGYWYAKPMPDKKFINFIAENDTFSI